MGKHTLSGVRFFRDLPQHEVEALDRHCTWKSYRRNEQIVSHKELSEDVYFVIRGYARAIIYSVTGKAVAYRDIGPGEIFGEYAAIDGQPRSASIETLEDSLVVCMSSKTFWQAIYEHPAFTKAVMRHFVRQLRSMTERVFEFSTLAVNNRVHAELLRLAREGSIEGNRASITRMPTHSEIASRISTHREAVTRELKRLQDVGMIRRDGPLFIITDLECLTDMVADVTGELQLV